MRFYISFIACIACTIAGYTALAADVDTTVIVQNTLGLDMGPLATDPNVNFPAISYGNKSNPETHSYGGIRAYSTKDNTPIIMTISSNPSNPGQNPYLIDTGNTDTSLPQDETRIYYSVQFSSCHKKTGTPTILDLKDNIGQIIPYPNSFQNNCFDIPIAGFNGQPGTLKFTRLAIPGILPISGTYTGTLTFTLNEM